MHQGSLRWLAQPETAPDSQVLAEGGAWHCQIKLAIEAVCLMHEHVVDRSQASWTG
jgi:hypothetical protein